MNLLERDGDLLVRHVAVLRDAVRRVRATRPFHIDAWVTLPDHLHCVWTLPAGDDDFSGRWRAIKIHFTKALPATEYRSPVRRARGERAIWQRRFWEHAIRNENDYRRHVEYCYINPVKHGYVTRVCDWPHSSFHRDTERGLFPVDLAGDASVDSATIEQA